VCQTLTLNHHSNLLWQC